jgi:hypothetical protein
LSRNWELYMGSLWLFPLLCLPSVCLVAGAEIGVVIHAKRDFYEKVTDVNARSLFFLRWCLSYWLRRMSFSTLFLYALCMGLRLCAGWGPMEKSMLPVFGRPR